VGWEGEGDTNPFILNSSEKPAYIPLLK
jgi:hypothetical protein